MIKKHGQIYNLLSAALNNFYGFHIKTAAATRVACKTGIFTTLFLLWDSFFLKF